MMIRVLVFTALAFPCFTAHAQSSAARAGVAAEMTPEGDRIVVEARGVKARVPLFFSATSENTVRLDAEAIAGEIKLVIHIVQGRPEVLTLGLSGDGEVTGVVGDGLRDWAVRREGEKRFLDLRPMLKAGESGSTQLHLTVRTRIAKPSFPGRLAPPILTSGDAVGFASEIALIPGDAVEVRLTKVDGIFPVGGESGPHATQRFYSAGAGFLEVALSPRGAAVADAELVGAQLVGKLDEAAGCMAFELTATARVDKIGARLALLAGGAALDELAGEGFHVETTDAKIELVFDRTGSFPIKLPFAAALKKEGDWQGVNFRVPAGTVVPVALEGLPGKVSFNPADPVVPDEITRRGFLPSSGEVRFGWRPALAASEGELSFTSLEQSDVRVGAGLLRQTSKIDFRVLQGKLPGVTFCLDGSGEILGVEGENVLSWKLRSGNGPRRLDVRLSRPLEKSGSLVVRSQSPLGGFPVRAEPLRLTPEGGVRHSGYVRVANNGAVRLEVAGVTGMMQLSPAQYPGQAVEKGVRQVFVYRFPSAGYTYHVMASQILAEVGVSQIVVYELAETDHVIAADLELDVREAPLREWSLAIPADYSLAGVSGSSVADYVAETQTRNGLRVLKILFTGAVEGRQLLHLRLEKSRPAAAGEWQLPPLVFPGAKSVRGHVGVVATPGFRVVRSAVANLVEMPLSYFPIQRRGLQQAYRLREPDWSAKFKVEALGQSVQADVFHLYSLKEGVVYGSVLFNYFVVGAPASEWRIEVPSSVGNIDVVGQNVRRDWRREGNQLIVPLHQPVLGAATLLVTFESPMSARGGAIKPGEVRPLGVQGERGFVQVVSPLQVKSQILKAEGALLKLEPQELPAEYQLLTSSPSLAAYQYIARPFELEMNIEWYALAETVGQLVDFARLASHVSRDGQVVTDVRYFVKTRSRKALRLVIPKGVRLWEARADREIVNARVDGAETLIPLPPRANPNEPVEVHLRLGQAARDPRAPVLTSPQAQVPIVISEWTVEGDPGRLLVPGGGTLTPNAPPLTETGFEWISAHAPSRVIVLLGFLTLGGWLLRAGAFWKASVGFLIASLVVMVALRFALLAAVERRVNVDHITYAAAVVPPGETVSIELANVGLWPAMASGWGTFSAVAGVVFGAMGLWRTRGRGPRIGWWMAGGAAFLGAGILAQRGGAIVFFLLVAAGVFFLQLLPVFLRWLRKPRIILQPAAVACLAALGLVFSAQAQETRPAESMVQSWKIQGGRLLGEVDLRVRGLAGDSFLLLKPPAVLTDFQSQGLRVTKVTRDGRTNYYVVLERGGVFAARAKFEVATGEFVNGFPLLAGPATVQRVSILLDQGGWEFFSAAAVRVQPMAGLSEKQSGAILVLRPADDVLIGLRPRSRDIGAETPRFFSEAENLFIPGPGVVNGFCRATIRPVQGLVSELELTVPNGFTVGEVRNGPVGEWRFDPETRRLRIAVSPPQSGNFKFDVETQLGTTALPVDLALEPVRVAGSAGEVGMIALAFGDDAQPENVRGLSAINLEDFDAGLVPKAGDGQPIATLQQAFRYGQEGGRIELKVAAVAPEIRVTTRQVMSFGDDRLVLAADLGVAITRAGLFKLSFELPEGLEVESISGAALSHWSESREADRRVITLQLQGRTIGDQTFAMTLTGAAPAAQKDWPVPRLRLREATRQTGEIYLVPEKGVRLQAVARENVSQIDPSAAGDTRPGTLGFRLLQENWNLKLGIEALEPWVTVQALQEVTMREGQTLTRIALRYRVDNAAVKRLRIRLPELTPSQLQTIRATGPAVSDFVKVEGGRDLWEIRFQRGVAGETGVQIEFQGGNGRAQGNERVTTPDFDGARQVAQFVAVRSSARLEVDAGAVPRGWLRVDWSAVPANLQDRTDRSVPALCFRVAEPEGPLAVAIHRHEMADALKLRVTHGELTTLFSPRGPSLTAVKLAVEVVEKSSLRVRLPKGSGLLSALVNGEGVPVVREGDAYLLNVAPKTDADRSADVRMVYSLTGARGREIPLVGPSLDVPLENVLWRLIVPPGFEMDGYSGSLRLADQKLVGAFGLDDYVSLSSATRSGEARRAAGLLEQANTLLAKGEQQQAGEVLSRAANGLALDEAANEDARVQLRTLKTQQAVVSLNTRRQRLYLDHQSNGGNSENAQLEQAANLNPFMQGKTNFDLQQVDRLLMGNTAEENSALRGIADRIVTQQLAADPAPGAIEVTLPESGKVLTFTRSIQVDGEAPLTLNLRISTSGGVKVWVALAMVLVGAAATGLSFPAPARKMAA